MLTTENTNQEAWRPVVGYEGWYEVSSLGRVRRLATTIRSSYGSTKALGQRVLRLMKKPKGYLYVALSRDGASKSANVHSIVLAAFAGPRPEGHQACHFNGDPSDNRIANLRWDTGSANCADRVRHGTAPMGERHPCARLLETDAREILGSHSTAKQLAARFGVSVQAIYHLRRGRTWKHLERFTA